MSSTKILVTLLSSVVLASPFLTTTTQAQGRPPSYCTWISRNDLYNTNGRQLGSIDQIIQQDRANVHKFGNPDNDPEHEYYFGSYENRAALAKAVRNSNIPSYLRTAIFSGNTSLCVVYFGNTVDISIP